MSPHSLVTYVPDRSIIDAFTSVANVCDVRRTYPRIISQKFPALTSRVIE